MSDSSTPRINDERLKALGLMGNPFRPRMRRDSTDVPLVRTIINSASLELLAQIHRAGSQENSRPIRLLKSPQLPEYYPVNALVEVLAELATPESGILATYVPLELMKRGRVRSALNSLGERLTGHGLEAVLTKYTIAVLADPDTELPEFAAVEDADLDEIVRLMIGKELSGSQESRELSFDGDLFRVEGLMSAYLSAPVSFAVRKKEILGITGLVGSGKTELARAIFGVDKLSGGTAYLGERQVHIDSPETAVGLGVGYLPEDRDSDGLCLNLGIKENISLVLLSKLKGLLLSVASEKRSVSRVVQSMNIKAAGLSQQVKYLSGGNKQKVVFGKWLSGGCNLLILDEPTFGIDVGARGEIHNLIREFVAEDEDRAVIFISSDITEILDVTDRILVMSGGSLVAELDPKHATKQEIMQHSLRVRRAVE